MKSEASFVPMPARDRVSMSPAEMLARYEADLARVPDSSLLHHGRGIALMLLGRFDAAEAALSRALELAPRHADAWVTLGDMHVLRKNRNAAQAAFLQALSIDETTPGAREGFAATAGFFLRWRLSRRVARKKNDQTRRETHPEAGRAIAEAARLGKSHHHAEAIDVMRKFLEDCPGEVSATATLSALLAGLGNIDQGKQNLERLVQWWPNNVVANYSLGAFLITIGERDAGIEWLQRTLTLAPDHANAKFALSTIGVAATPQLGLDEVRGTFDAYAEKFDHDLQDNLQYRVPEMIAAQVGNKRWKRVLDLGCGTGLCGMQLRPFAEQMIGVDLSDKMLAKARERGVYDVLERGEGVAYLQRASGHFDLIVAADVLVYIGDVTALFQAVAARLTADGAFWFSVELAPQEGFRITMSRRYQHSLSYLESSAHAAGLKVAYQREIDLRKHAAEMQKGLLVALELGGVR